MADTSSNVKAIIFDFDGTIADSFPTFIRAVETVLKRTPFTPEEIEDLRQHSARELLKILHIRMWQLPYLAAKGTKEIDRHQEDIVIFPDMADTLRTLRQQGFKLYIVSSHSGQGIDLFLEQYDLVGIFDFIHSDIGLFGKPKALKKLCKKFQYQGSECVFVGDEVRDIEAAKKAGTHCVSVSWGFNGPASLQAHNPTALIDEPSDLIATVQR